jgi:hypothetical protein
MADEPVPPSDQSVNRDLGEAANCSHQAGRLSSHAQSAPSAARFGVGRALEPSRSLGLPGGKPRSALELALKHWLDGIDRFRDEKHLLDVRCEEKQVQYLRNASAGEAKRSREAGAIFDGSAVDRTLQMVSQGKRPRHPGWLTRWYMRLIAAPLDLANEYQTAFALVSFHAAAPAVARAARRACSSALRRWISIRPLIVSTTIWSIRTRRTAPLSPRGRMGQACEKFARTVWTQFAVVTPSWAFGLIPAMRATTCSSIAAARIGFAVHPSLPCLSRLVHL